VPRITSCRLRPVISDSRAPVCTVSNIMTWSRRPDQVFKLGTANRASTSARVRKAICLRAYRLLGIASTRWICEDLAGISKAAKLKNERMAASRILRLRAVMPRLFCNSSRNALMNGASISSNATRAGGICNRFRAN
jgi:hypothetical protein